MEFLYSDGEKYCFMDTSSYEQEFFLDDQVGDLKFFLKENIACTALLFDNNPIGISLPIFVELRITHAEPWAKGDTAAGSTKPATLETGYVVQVPPFVNEGELIRIDTRSGEYVERVKE